MLCMLCMLGLVLLQTLCTFWSGRYGVFKRLCKQVRCSAFCMPSMLWHSSACCKLAQHASTRALCCHALRLRASLLPSAHPQFESRSRRPRSRRRSSVMPCECRAQAQHLMRAAASCFLPPGRRCCCSCTARSCEHPLPAAAALRSAVPLVPLPLLLLSDPLLSSLTPVSRACRPPLLQCGDQGAQAAPRHRCARLPGSLGGMALSALTLVAGIEGQSASPER